MKQRRRTLREKNQASALEFRHLRAFVALVDQGSIIGAAQALGLAQSTVSESLAALERALGTPVTLRRRGAHGVLLTAVGQTLLPHARNMLASLDDAHASVSGVTNNAHATLEIITNESVSAYLLPEVLAALRARWVNTRFAVSVATCSGVRAGVHGGEFDLGLLLEVDEVTDRAAASSESSNTSTFSSDRIVIANNVPLVIFAGLSNPLARDGKTVRRDELAGYPLFMSDAAGDFHELVSRFFESDGVPGPHLEATGSVEGVKRGVATDPLALGILPAYAIAEELQSALFVTLSVRPNPPRMQLEGLLSKRRARHPVAAELINSMCRALS
ncbi:MAG: LysR family transcriptional regulator [Pyrinomonadaceae bacterium]|nr:LysR family transcriptional regulator [Pyrinomonadaceae bacterium]